MAEMAQKLESRHLPLQGGSITPSKCCYSIEAGRGGKASFLTKAAQRAICIDPEDADGAGSRVQCVEELAISGNRRIQVNAAGGQGCNHGSR